MLIKEIILDSLKKYGENNIIFHNRLFYKYSEMKSLVNRINNCVLKINSNQQLPVLIMGNHSFFSYGGVYSSIVAGNYYVPLNEDFPLSRNLNIIEQSGGKIFILDVDNFHNYESILEQIKGCHILINKDSKELSEKYADNYFYNVNEYSSECVYDLSSKESDIVYLLFTSGTTGKPKGIAVNSLNLKSYIDSFISRNDAMSYKSYLQMSDLTFDLSVHTVFLPIVSGSCIYFTNKIERLNPLNFINKHGIEHLMFVPSVLAVLKKLRLLGKALMPGVKYGGFCGETLSFENALLFSISCPNAKCENLYGPTEATVACTYFEFNSSSIEKKEYIGSMPIGCANKDMSVELYNMDKNNIGEIIISGPQVTRGYYNNDELTKERYKTINGKWYYFTGDLGKKIDNNLVFIGRNDAQVQIRGYRVELYEIESSINKMENVVECAVLPVPLDVEVYDNVIAFVIVNGEIESNSIKLNLVDKLPSYMVPSKFIVLDEMPYNVNGKIDKNKLKDIYKSLCYSEDV